jgi:hypothetical protein
MDNLKKLNFTELDSSEMKHVQGGGVLTRQLVYVNGILPSSPLNGSINVLQALDEPIDGSAERFFNTISSDKDSVLNAVKLALVDAV